MGAQDFIIRQTAMDANEAYTLAVEEAQTEHGNDTYNGTISTTIGCINLTKKFRESKKDRQKFINEVLVNASKRSCYVIEERAPIYSNNKVKSTVEHSVVKGTSKWELRYEVYSGWDHSNLVSSHKTKTDAVKSAREYTEKTRVSSAVIMSKVLVNQNAMVAKIKYKPGTEKEGTYILFGVAAC